MPAGRRQAVVYCVLQCAWVLLCKIYTIEPSMNAILNKIKAETYVIEVDEETKNSPYGMKG